MRHHEQTQAKSTRGEREAPGEEDEDEKCPKSKMIWVELEEAQDYVRESLDLTREEAEEASFVPSAISVPQRSMFGCDNRCSEKALSFWQCASVVTEEGEESYTTNLCQQGYNKNLIAKGDAPLTKWQWYAVVEKKAHRGRLWRMLGKDQCIRRMWEYCFCERLKAKKFREDAEKETVRRDTRPMAT